MAMHLVDPQFLINYADDGQRIAENSDTFNIYSAIKNIALFMRDGNTMFLDNAIIDLSEDYTQAVVRIAKVLQYGADRYEPNNWRLIPEEEHINHALIHIIAHLMGDTQDNHIDHALCRLMMAYSTKKSEDFDYSNYVKKSS